MNGITVEQRGSRYRVLRTFAGGTVATIGVFSTVGEALTYATERVLELDEEES